MLNKASFTGLLSFLVSISVCTVTIAQTPLALDSQVQQVLSEDEQFQDFIIPKNDSLSQLILEVKGADGGWIEYTYKDRFNTIRTQRVQSGEGTMVSAVYSIGAGFGEIPPGSTLRMMIGKRGQWAKYDLLMPGNFGASGGGGTAILVSKDRGNTWRILMVAGGGGGAGVQFINGKFTSLTGRSTSHFIRAIQLSEAQKILRHSEMTISEGAFAVGFNDPSYFSRTYREEFGENPKSARI